MLVQMAVKQVSANVIEYFQPILLSKKNLDELAEEFRPVINKFKESGVFEDKDISKEGMSQSKDDLLSNANKKNSKDGADK